MKRLRRLRSERGQSTAEYVLTISVLVIAMGAVFYQLIGKNGNKGPIATSFKNVREVVEAPYP
jgi:hypothetical protein